MLRINEEQSSHPHLVQRLRAALRDVDLGNGTPVADAAATALGIDLRMSGWNAADAEGLLTLSDDRIVAMGADIIRALETEGSTFTLPFGTEVETIEPGAFRIAGEIWIADAGSAGLHPIETSRRDAHGPNLELLRADIERLSRRHAYRCIGLPSPASIVVNDVWHLLQFPPCDEAGGVVLQRWANCTDAPRFSAASPTQITTFAETIVEDMKLLWKHRDKIGTRAAAVREHAQAAASFKDVSVLKVSVDLSLQRTAIVHDMYVEYGALDEAMRMGAVLDFRPGHDRLDPGTARIPPGVRARRRHLDELRARGADGWVDEVAYGLAVHAPGGLEAVISCLATEYQTAFALPATGMPLYATLFWNDGVIRAEVAVRSKLDLYGKTLNLIGTHLPDTVVALLAGRRVDSFAELPFDCPCRVVEANSIKHGLALELDIPIWPLNTATGEIWRDPETDLTRRDRLIG